MPLGITNLTPVNMTNLTQIANFTTPEQFFINVNHVAFGGWLFFLLLLTATIVAWLSMQDKKDQPLINAMFAFAGASILAFFLRAINYTNASGNVVGLLTDFQMWIFPIITAILAALLWGTRQ